MTTTTTTTTMMIIIIIIIMIIIIQEEQCSSDPYVLCLQDFFILQKVKSGMSCPDWHKAMHSLRLQRLSWIYCPGHTGVSGNEQADRLASTADITSGLQLGRTEVLRGLRNFLNTDRPEHHSINRLKERRVERRSGRHSALQSREQTVFNQTNTGIWYCFEGNLGEIAERRGGARVGLSERYDAIFS